MDLFWLYRATAPTVRAQAIQVISATHAMAERGHHVTVAVEPPEGQRPSPADVLAFYGLEPAEGLDLVVLPGSRTLASAAFRALFARWLLRTRGRGVVIARSKRYADEALRWAGGRFTLVLEVHEVDSEQERERGGDPEPIRALEARVLRASRAVVANAPGTLRLLREVHPALPPAVALHNATHPSRARHPTGPGEGIGYVGSFLRTKGLETLATAAASTRERVHLVGAQGAEELQPLAGGRLVVEPPLRHADVPDRLAAFRALVLPLGSGLFGEQLTSPLKLWDYLASGVPIAGADTPALRDAAPGAFLPYRPDDAADLARALDRVCADEALRAELLGKARLRTWAERAAEYEAFLARALA